MPRVLIVDDNEDLRETYALLLEGEGFDVHGVADGVAGLQAVRCEHPDVVLLDMMMPDLDGLQFLAQLPGACSPPEPRDE